MREMIERLFRLIRLALGKPVHGADVTLPRGTTMRDGVVQAGHGVKGGRGGHVYINGGDFVAGPDGLTIRAGNGG